MHKEAVKLVTLSCLFLPPLAKALPESFINDKVYKGSVNVFCVDRKYTFHQWFSKDSVP